MKNQTKLNRLATRATALAASLLLLTTAVGCSTTETPATDTSPAIVSTDTASPATEQDTSTTEKSSASTEKAGTSTEKTSTSTETETITPAAMPTATAVDVNNVSGTFTFTDSGVTAAGASADSYKAEGTDLTIKEAGTYLITGSASEGSITVKKGTTGVILILSDLTLTSSDSAVLSINKESAAIVYVTGTVTLTDAENPEDENSTDAEVADAYDGAVIKVKAGAALLLTGDGTLNLDGSADKNGIKTGEQTSFTIDGSLTLQISAANNGISAENQLTIQNGTLNILAEKDGIKAESDDETLGTLIITGGTLTVRAYDDGIAAASLLQIDGGTLDVQASDDAFHSDGDLLVNGGTLAVACGDDAFHAENNLSLGEENGTNGPTITVTASHEGLEGASIALYAGTGTITADDDGVNAADGSTWGSSASLTIAGGNWVIDSKGDGLDSNANVSITGGTTIVYGAADNGNSGLDYDGTCTQTGGTLLVVGTSGMAQGNGGLAATFSGVSISSGATLELKDASGKTLLTATSPRNANWVLYSSESLSSGDSVTLYVNGSAISTQTVTQSQSGGGMMGGPGMGGQMGGPGMGGQMGGMGAPNGQMSGKGGFPGRR